MGQWENYTSRFEYLNGENSEISHELVLSTIITIDNINIRRIF